MKRKRWYAFSGIVEQKQSTAGIIDVTGYEVFRENTQEVIASFDNYGHALTYIDTVIIPEWQARGISADVVRRIYVIRSQKVEKAIPALQHLTYLVPLNPVPAFTSPGKILTTRGFWDVAVATSPTGEVANAAFGMVMMPIGSVAKVSRTQAASDAPYLLDYEWFDDTNPTWQLPDPLYDDPGFFCYDSFVRVTTQINQDPPFHSKTQKKFAANSMLVVIASVEVSVENLQTLDVDFGIRFRVLIEF